MVSQLFTPIRKMAQYYLINLFTRGKKVVKNGQNSVYVVVEWPQRQIGKKGFSKQVVF